jgi:hypothetical protein
MNAVLWALAAVALWFLVSTIECGGLACAPYIAFLLCEVVVPGRLLRSGLCIVHHCTLAAIKPHLVLGLCYGELCLVGSLSLAWSSAVSI